MAGVTVPLQPVRHQYVMTQPIDGLASDAATVRDPDRRTYFKEEVGGLVMGGYEPDRNPGSPGRRRSTGDVPGDFQFQLFDDDWDHFEQHMAEAVARVPALERAGVKQMINGPESFTPDGNFILGRVARLLRQHVSSAAASMPSASRRAAAPAGRWPNGCMEDEAPSRPVARRHPALLPTCMATGTGSWRPHARSLWQALRASAFPMRKYERAPGRASSSPLYERLKARRSGIRLEARLGAAELVCAGGHGGCATCRPMGRAELVRSGRRGTPPVCANAVGVFDQSSFAKFELIGPDALAVLDWLAANDVRKPVGRITYTQMLNAKGGIECDLTIARVAEDRFYIVTGTGFRSHDQGWILDNMRDGSHVELVDVTEAYGTLSLMGPRARDVLQAVVSADVDNQAFPFGHLCEVEIAGVPLRALRITYVGELGYELHVSVDGIVAVFDALMAAGAEHGIAPCGYRAIESLRLEKGFRAWGSDTTPNDTPFEAGLGWAVKMSEDIDFQGRDALASVTSEPPKKRFVGFTVDDADVVLLGRETILRDGEVVGYLTSGGFGYTIGRPIGYGYVRHGDGVTDGFLESGRYELVVAAETVPAVLHRTPLYDPGNRRVKM